MAAERGPHSVVERAQARPRGRDLHRVREGAGHEHRRLPIADAVTVLEPVPGRLFAEGAGAEAGSDLRGAGEVRGALGGKPLEDQDQRRAAEDARAQRVDGLVEQAWTLENVAQ